MTTNTKIIARFIMRSTWKKMVEKWRFFDVKQLKRAEQGDEPIKLQMKRTLHFVGTVWNHLYVNRSQYFENSNKIFMYEKIAFKNLVSSKKSWKSGVAEDSSRSDLFNKIQFCHVTKCYLGKFLKLCESSHENESWTMKKVQSRRSLLCKTGVWLGNTDLR